ncbi:hypothetical protein [Clostridium sp. DJ247]|nr:hypothetical protein [Clostridium sp. DJ247]MBC2579593.1 hypothetical protein [Clostridium sp. DJ247]
MSIARSPLTPASEIENIITEVDMILAMTVNPGFAGEKLILQQ